MKNPLVYLAFTVYFNGVFIDVFRNASVQNQNAQKVFLRQADVLEALRGAGNGIEVLRLADEVNVKFIETCVDLSGVYTGFYAYKPKDLYQKLRLSPDAAARKFADFMEKELPTHI